MRGLNVYCCPTCGHYGFFQLVANAVCPHCSIAMTPLPIPYQDFMDLDYPQRQILISRHMINAASHLDSKAKPANKAKAPGQTKPSGRSNSLDDEKSADQNAAPDNIKLMTIILQHRVKQNRLPLPRRSIRIFQKIPTRKRSIRKYWL